MRTFGKEGYTASAVVSHAREPPTYDRVVVPGPRGHGAAHQTMRAIQLPSAPGLLEFLGEQGEATLALAVSRQPLTH